MQAETQKKPRSHVLWTLFCSMFSISAVTFGGGFVIVSFMKRRFVDELHWMEEQEMLDLTALAQSAPGAIAVNAAILVGWRVAGLWGFLVAVLGTVIPPVTILSIVSLCYSAFAENVYVAMALRGMQAGVAAVVMDVVLTLGAGVVRGRSRVHNLLMVAAFCAAFFGNVNVIFLILAGALTGVALALWQRRKGK